MQLFNLLLQSVDVLFHRSMLFLSFINLIVQIIDLRIELLCLLLYLFYRMLLLLNDPAILFNVLICFIKFTLHLCDLIHTCFSHLIYLLLFVLFKLYLKLF